MEKPHIDTTAVEVPADLASPALYRVDAAHHPRVDRAEMLRYLGYGGQQIEPELSRRIELVVERLELDIEPRGVRRVFAVDATGVDEQSEPCIRLVGTNVELRGRDIYRHLKDARFAALMACTLGMDAERRLRTTGAQQPLEGAVLDAACSAYVEAAVEQMDQQVKTDAAAHGLAGPLEIHQGEMPLKAPDIHGGKRKALLGDDIRFQSGPGAHIKHLQVFDLLLYGSDQRHCRIDMAAGAAA